MQHKRKNLEIEFEIKLTSFISHLTNVKKLFAYDLVLYVKIIKSTRIFKVIITTYVLIVGYISGYLLDKKIFSFIVGLG